MDLTAPQKLKQLLVRMTTDETPTAPEDIEQKFESLGHDLADATCELRSGQWDTGLDCESSRHYESRSVAAEMLDGSVVGWTYWYGGGKHGEPEGVPWIEHAYDLEMVEVMRPVKVFMLKDK